VTDTQTRTRAAIKTLRENDSLRFATYVEEGDPVVVAIAIRGIGVCELEIQTQNWDLQKFLNLVQHSSLQYARPARKGPFG
jgi:hypothetical protein